MKLLYLFFLLISYIHASNLLTYNIYERSDRVDIMLSFDSPYEGRISQKKGANITILTLKDLSYDKLIEKNVKSDIIQAITLEPKSDFLNVILKSKNSIVVYASKTVDGFGLRIRTKKIASTDSNTNKKEQTKLLSKQTKTPYTTKISDNLIDSRYISVMVILFIMLIFMFWLKRKVTNKSKEVNNKKSWLFKSSSLNTSNSDINVLCKKEVDEKNSVLLIEFEQKKYLVMSGSSNLLLEKFSGDDIKSNSDFEQAFENNRKKLDEYLKLQENQSLDNYKAKASRDYISQLE